LFSALGWIGVFAIFVLIILIAYIPNRATSVYEVDRDARMEIRQEVDSSQSGLKATYEWVNQQEGLVRIPVDRAMRLTVEELRGKQTEPDGPNR